MASGGESDTRNDYDMIAASEGLDAGALTFAFRPMWQLDAATAASVALQKAQATQIYAGLKLWPAAVTAKLVEAQLAEDGTYPNAAAVLAENVAPPTPASILDFDPAQPRDPYGRWTAGRGGAAASLIRVNGNERKRELEKELEETGGAPPPVEELTPDLLEPFPRMTPRGVLGPGGAALPLRSNPPLSPNPAPLAAPLGAPAPAGTSLPGIVGPGPFAREGIPAGPSIRLDAEQKRQNNVNGYRWGCHWCGTKDPGQKSGNFFGDHQPPTALNPDGGSQFIFPHCKDCSDRQGGYVRWLKLKGYSP